MVEHGRAYATAHTAPQNAPNLALETGVSMKPVRPFATLPLCSLSLQGRTSADGRLQGRTLNRQFRQAGLETKEFDMNWDIVKGNWKQFRGKVKAQWGKLTDDHLDVIAGKRDELAGKIQETYGITKDEAEKQIKHFEDLNKE
jgi:uncharacterized protein YjbJ (UPF0337 family)